MTAHKSAPEDDRNKSPEQLEREIAETRSQIDYTLNALRERMSPGEVLDQALAYWREGPRDQAAQFGNNLGRSVRNNPLAVSLVGVGLAWLMMPQSRKGVYLHSGDDDRDYYADDTEAGARRVYVPSEYTSRAERDRSSGDKGRLDSAKDSLSSKADALSRKAGSVKDSVGASARQAGDRIQAAGRDMRATGREYGDRARAQARVTAQRARIQAARARDGAQQMFREQPLVVGALGLAAGALLAAALPATRREDELAGEHRDRLVASAREKGREGVDAAKRAAQAAGEAASEEADRQGLTPEAGEAKARSTADKLESVVRAAAEATKSETGRSNGSGANSGYGSQQHHS